MEREVIIFLLPISMMTCASFLKNESRVDHVVWGLPSTRLSVPKKGFGSLDAVSESGSSFCGSSQAAGSSPMLVVVVVTMIDEVEVEGGSVVVTGAVVVVVGAMVVVVDRIVVVEVERTVLVLLELEVVGGV
jgi:hypothetical protein